MDVSTCVLVRLSWYGVARRLDVCRPKIADLRRLMNFRLWRRRAAETCDQSERVISTDADWPIGSCDWTSATPTSLALPLTSVSPAPVCRCYGSWQRPAHCQPVSPPFLGPCAPLARPPPPPKPRNYCYCRPLGGATPRKVPLPAILLPPNHAKLLPPSQRTHCFDVTLHPQSTSSAFSARSCFS